MCSECHSFLLLSAPDASFAWVHCVGMRLAGWLAIWSSVPFAALLTLAEHHFHLYLAVVQLSHRTAITHMVSLGYCHIGSRGL